MAEQFNNFTASCCCGQSCVRWSAALTAGVPVSDVSVTRVGPAPRVTDEIATDVVPPVHTDTATTALVSASRAGTENTALSVYAL